LAVKSGRDELALVRGDLTGGRASGIIGKGQEEEGEEESP